MITVIIEGTKNIRNTLRSLQANAQGPFRVFVDESVREELSKIFQIEFVKPSLIRKYGPKSDFYWILRSGCLVLCAAWDLRIELCKKDDRVYCLHPSGVTRNFITNRQRNIGRWRGVQYPVPVLSITEV